MVSCWDRSAYPCPSSNLLSPPKPQRWDKKKKKKASVSPLPPQLALGRIQPQACECPRDVVGAL